MADFFYRQLAKASQNRMVTSGQQVTLNVDLALAHDGSGPEILDILRKEDGKNKGYCRALMTLDHCFPAPTPEDRKFQVEFRTVARHYNIRLYKNGEGVLHQVVAEEESLWPGMIIVGADGHVATAGAFGAISFPISCVQFARTLATGMCTVNVPDQVVVKLDGERADIVMARDIAMHLAAHYRKRIEGRAVLLTGETIDFLSISEKMSICNYLPEAGAATALVLPQGENEHVDIFIDTAAMRPMVLMPGDVPEYVSPGETGHPQITTAIAGGCSAGRLDDMQIIADVLAKQEVHPDVTFIITPASKNIMESMDKLKISSILRNAGAVIMPPGCGPCPGKHFGVLCESDVAITTTIRNTPGRIGAEDAKIYLASPLTVAWSAVNGKITEPVS